MSANSLSVPFPVFNDSDGRALDAGYIYIGSANFDPETNPISVYFDDALTIPAPQPIRTINGYPSNSGTPSTIYINANDYSMTVRNKKSELVYTSLAATDRISSSLITYNQGGTGAVSRTLQSKLGEWVSIKDFGAVGDGSNEFTKIKAAWDYCIANGVSLFFPAGTYSSGVNNMPFKHPDYPATTLLDCGNITIFGEGPDTILKSDSESGADVLNLYSVKNLHFRNMKVTADLSAFLGAGSNGCSIVGGFDNLTFDHLWFENLPYVDKALYLDGGKGFTIQPGSPTTECGTIKATNIFVKGCVYGCGLEIDLVNWATKKHAIDIDIVAEDCYIGVIYSAGAASGALSAAMTSGYRVKAQLINCQRNVVVGRAHGIEIEAGIVTTKLAPAKRLNPDGGTWNSVDSIVDGLSATYAKNSRLVIYGDIGECDYKAQIGGATAGSSGQGGQSDNCDIFIDLAGQANTADFNAVNSGGNIMTESTLVVTNSTTASALPTAFYATSYNNTITKGSSKRLTSAIIASFLDFAYTDGVTSYTRLEREDFGLFAKQTGGSSGNLLILGAKDHNGNKKFAIRNDGAIASEGRNTASAVTTVNSVLPIYNTAGTLIGYTPIYTTYTP